MLRALQNSTACACCCLPHPLAPTCLRGAQPVAPAPASLTCEPVAGGRQARGGVWVAAVAGHTLHVVALRGLLTGRHRSCMFGRQGSGLRSTATPCACSRVSTVGIRGVACPCHAMCTLSPRKAHPLESVQLGGHAVEDEEQPEALQGKRAEEAGLGGRRQCRGGQVWAAVGSSPPPSTTLPSGAYAPGRCQQ